MSEASVPGPAYIQATRVTGTSVFNREGERLGKIEDIVLTKVEGHAVYAVLSFGGVLGIGDDHYPIPWPHLRYDTSRGGYMVDMTRTQIEGAPRYRRDDAPDWGDPVWGTRLNEHYRPPVMDPVEGERRV